MKRQMKGAIIVILVIAFILAVIVGVWYYKTKFYVPDKYGMLYSVTDTITYCQYESGGGMNGELTEAQIYIKDNGEVWLKYHYCYPVGIDKSDEEAEYLISAKAIEDISNICKKYGVLGWGKLKLSDIEVLDGATEEIALKYSDKEYYSFNSGHKLPDGSEKIFDEISEIINQYK